jgi:hypothetical protein
VLGYAEHGSAQLDRASLPKVEWVNIFEYIHILFILYRIHIHAGEGAIAKITAFQPYIAQSSGYRRVTTAFYCMFSFHKTRLRFAPAKKKSHGCITFMISISLCSPSSEIIDVYNLRHYMLYTKVRNSEENWSHSRTFDAPVTNYLRCGRLDVWGNGKEDG